MAELIFPPVEVEESPAVLMADIFELLMEGLPDDDDRALDLTGSQVELNHIL